jgi:hypothetical protein
MTGTGSRTFRGLAALAVTLLLLAAGAEAAGAAKSSVRDPRFDTPYLSRHGRVDITRATARRELGGVRHSVTMRARVRPARHRERPAIIINTRGGKRSPFEYVVFNTTIFRVPKKGAPKAIGAAELAAKGRTWTYDFDLDEVRGLGAGYGGAATTQKRSGKFADVAPGRGYVRSP